jgi:hypothetical protein
MNALHIITANGIDAVATVEEGRHGGGVQVLAIRDTNGTTLLGLPVAHASEAILSTLLDAGTVATVRDTFGI